MPERRDSQTTLAMDKLRGEHYSARREVLLTVSNLYGHQTGSEHVSYTYQLNLHRGYRIRR
jgi:hypothetical protein